VRSQIEDEKRGKMKSNISPGLICAKAALDETTMGRESLPAPRESIAKTQMAAVLKIMGLSKRPNENTS
jgi:hypothetical protein